MIKFIAHLCRNFVNDIAIKKMSKQLVHISKNTYYKSWDSKRIDRSLRYRKNAHIIYCKTNIKTQKSCYDKWTIFRSLDEFKLEFNWFEPVFSTRLMPVTRIFIGEIRGRLLMDSNDFFLINQLWRIRIHFTMNHK